jgi:hypothetical protein
MSSATAAADKKTRTSSLRGELIATLVFKAVVLVAIYVLAFGAGHRPPADAAATAAAIAGAGPGAR